MAQGASEHKCSPIFEQRTVFDIQPFFFSLVIYFNHCALATISFVPPFHFSVQDSIPFTILTDIAVKFCDQTCRAHLIAIRKDPEKFVKRLLFILHCLLETFIHFRPFSSSFPSIDPPFNLIILTGEVRKTAPFYSPLPAGDFYTFQTILIFLPFH